MKIELHSCGLPVNKTILFYMNVCVLRAFYNIVATCTGMYNLLPAERYFNRRQVYQPRLQHWLTYSSPHYMYNSTVRSLSLCFLWPLDLVVFWF
jgi:hypothetical protein